MYLQREKQFMSVFEQWWLPIEAMIASKDAIEDPAKAKLDANSDRAIDKITMYSARMTANAAISKGSHKGKPRISRMICQVSSFFLG